MLSPVQLAPSAAPSGVNFNMVNSSGFTLMWNAPPPENHNGYIRHYVIHIIEVNTGIEYTLTSVATQKSIDFLHPYYNYTCTLSAVTNQLGPFSAAINITTSEDGKLHKHRADHVMVYMHVLKASAKCEQIYTGMFFEEKVIC